MDAVTEISSIVVDELEFFPGDYFQGRDRERKNFTLKYERITNGMAIIKQMGRNTTHFFRIPLADAGDQLGMMFRKIERVYKF
jgi:hypothetical protein